jgi:hypothetical protein
MCDNEGLGGVFGELQIKELEEALFINKFCVVLGHFDESLKFKRKVATISILHNSCLVDLAECDQEGDGVEFCAIFEDPNGLWPVWSIWHRGFDHIQTKTLLVVLM